MAKRKAQFNDLLNQAASTSTVAGSGKVLLKTADGKRRFTLVDEKQKLTDFGKQYYEHTGETFQPHYDLEQTLIREKEKEYITLRNGQKKLARRLVDDSYNYTKIGKAFFRNRGDVVEYLAHLPVTITGTNSKTGKKYTRIWAPTSHGPRRLSEDRCYAEQRGTRRGGETIDFEWHQGWHSSGGVFRGIQASRRWQLDDFQVDHTRERR